MRPPVALALFGAGPVEVRSAALTQARVTHHNMLTDAATLCVVEMVQAALAGGGRGAVLARAHALVTAQPLFTFRSHRRENPTGYIVDTMRAVLQAIDTRDGFEAVLVDVVNRGGDADTTGAIAGMIMGALVGETGLPVPWRKAVKRHVRGRCVELACALMQMAPGYEGAQSPA